MEIIVFLSIVIAVLAVLTSIVLVRRVKKQIAEMTDALLVFISAILSPYDELFNIN